VLAGATAALVHALHEKYGSAPDSELSLDGPGRRMVSAGEGGWGEEAEGEGVGRERSAEGG
jgi:hypothetical protein